MAPLCLSFLICGRRIVTSKDYRREGLLPATSRNINEKSYRAATGRVSPVLLDYVTSVALTGGSPKPVLGPVTVCHPLLLLLSHHQPSLLSMWTPQCTSTTSQTHQRLPHSWSLNQGVCVPCHMLPLPAVSKCRGRKDGLVARTSPTGHSLCTSFLFMQSTFSASLDASATSSRRSYCYIVEFSDQEGGGLLLSVPVTKWILSESQKAAPPHTLCNNFLQGGSKFHELPASQPR